jgi:hypothetical protein
LTAVTTEVAAPKASKRFASIARWRGTGSLLPRTSRSISPARDRGRRLPLAACRWRDVYLSQAKGGTMILSEGREEDRSYQTLRWKEAASAVDWADQAILIYNMPLILREQCCVPHFAEQFKQCIAADGPGAEREKRTCACNLSKCRKLCGEQPSCNHPSQIGSCSSSPERMDGSDDPEVEVKAQRANCRPMAISAREIMVQRGWLP